MKVLDKLKQFIADRLHRGNRDDDGAEPAYVGARLKPRPKPGASAVALSEPD